MAKSRQDSNDDFHAIIEEPDEDTPKSRNEQDPEWAMKSFYPPASISGWMPASFHQKMPSPELPENRIEKVLANAKKAAQSGRRFSYINRSRSEFESDSLN